MKLSTGLVLVCLIVRGAPQLTPNQYARIKEISKTCAEELEITLEESFLNSEPYDGILFNDDDKNKMFIACFLTNLGAVSPEGLILESKLLEFMAEGSVPAELEDTVVKCAGVAGDSLEDRAYNFHKCYWAKRTGEH